MHDAGHPLVAAAASTIIRVAPKNNGISIVNPGKKYKTAYPVCTFTYVIVPKSTPKAKELRTFIHWALTKGQAFGPKLLFVPIPKVIRRSQGVARRAARPLAQASRPAQAARRRRSGSRSPRPGALVASTSPPAAVTMCFTIASPSPVPREARARSAR